MLEHPTQNSTVKQPRSQVIPESCHLSPFNSIFIMGAVDYCGHVLVMYLHCLLGALPRVTN